MAPPKIDTIFIIVFAGLLFFRFPFLISAGMKVGGEWLLKLILPFSLPTRTKFIFEGSTYMLTAFLIWWKRKSLLYFHIPRDALIIFVGSPILYATLFDAGDRGYLPLIRMIVAVILGIAIYPTFKKLPKLELKQYLNGLIFTLIIAFALDYFIPKVVGTLIFQQPLIERCYNSIGAFFYRFQFQIYTAAILEEPLFRGFTWGFLKSLRIKEGWILLI